MTSQKKDLFNHEGRYKKWKEQAEENGISGISPQNSKVLMAYIFDMEIGANVSSKGKKGARSYGRLNNLKQRMIQMARIIEKRSACDITTISEEELFSLFLDMRNGIIQKQMGGHYKSVVDYIKIFKAFWHWHMKVSKKEKIKVFDITEDLDTSVEEQPDFVHITKEQFDEYIEFYDPEEKLYFTEEEKTCLLFCYDSLTRSPTELFSLMIPNIYKKDEDTWTHIPGEISKTFGRHFNLLYSGEMILEHIKRKHLSPNDYLFDLSYNSLTRKMQKISVKKFGKGVADIRSGGRWEDITLYDLRHSGAIHLRILAKENPSMISLDAIRERGGWTDFKMLDYYTKRIGLDGHIPKISISTNEEDKLIEIGIDKEALRQRAMDMFENQMQVINKSFVNTIGSLRVNPIQTQLPI